MKKYPTNESFNTFEIVKSFKCLEISIDPPLTMNINIHLLKTKNTSIQKTPIQIKDNKINNKCQNNDMENIFPIINKIWHKNFLDTTQQNQ